MGLLEGDYSYSSYYKGTTRSHDSTKFYVPLPLINGYIDIDYSYDSEDNYRMSKDRVELDCSAKIWNRVFTAVDYGNHVETETRKFDRGKLLRAVAAYEYIWSDMGQGYAEEYMGGIIKNLLYGFEDVKEPQAVLDKLYDGKVSVGDLVMCIISESYRDARIREAKEAAKQAKKDAKQAKKDAKIVARQKRREEKALLKKQKKELRLAQGNGLDKNKQNDNIEHE